MSITSDSKTVLLESPEKSISLNPKGCITDSELLSLSFERHLKRGGWQPNSDMRNIHIERCHPLIKQNLVELAYTHKKTQADIGRLAMHLGILPLWSLPGIEGIRAIRSFIHKKTCEQEDREWFFAAKFAGLQSAHPIPLHNKFYECDVIQCDGLTSALGLKDPGVIRQLSLMVALIHFPDVPYKDRKNMVKILKEFKQWVMKRLERAKEIRKMVEQRKAPVDEDMPTSWEDVMKD